MSVSNTNENRDLNKQMAYFALFFQHIICISFLCTPSDKNNRKNYSYSTHNCAVCRADMSVSNKMFTLISVTIHCSY